MAPKRGAIQQQVADVRQVAEVLEPRTGRRSHRRARFAALQERFSESPVASQQQLSRLMSRWSAGLFVGIKGRPVPSDNLDLERWFRLPKGHERRIHGHKHAGVRLVREGPTLMPTLDAHRERPGLFQPEELRPYANHPPPADQIEAQHRHQVMRQARSKKQRTGLLQKLQRIYLDKS